MFENVKFTPFSQKEITWNKEFPLWVHCMECFNNFFYQFPAGNKPFVPRNETIEKYGYQRYLMLHAEPPLKFPKFSKEDDYTKPAFLSAEEFYTELDATVVESGISLEYLSQLLNPMITRQERDKVAWKEVCKRISVIYKMMREKGYPMEILTR